MGVILSELAEQMQELKAYKEADGIDVNSA